MNYPLQKLGTVLLVVSLVLLFLVKFFPELVLLSLGLVFWSWAALGIVLLIDFWLVYKKQDTITQWYRRKWPKKLDYVLTVGIVVAFVIFHSPIVGLYLCQGTINGHLNGDW